MFKRFHRFLFIAMLAVLALPSHAGNSSSLTDSLFNRNQDEEEFLSPDLAFGLEMSRSQQQIMADFKVAPGYYLYKITDCP